MVRPLIWLIVMVSLSMAISHGAAPRTSAAGVVTSCTEAAFDAAISGGGMVTFGCSGTITFTSTKVVGPGTSLAVDGTGRAITLSGANAVQLFRVQQGGELHLRGITLAQGRAERGGAIWVQPGGRLIAEQALLTGNAAQMSGGAIYSDGETRLTRTALRDNSAAGGGAIASYMGQLFIEQSTFDSNAAVGPEDRSGGAISLGVGNATVAASLFANNTAAGGAGGAINVVLATLSVSNSTFAGNTAVHGGGIASFGIVHVANSTFAGNTGGAGGISNGVHGGVTGNDPRVLSITNTILHGNLTTGCASNRPITNGGGNLTSDGSCGLPKGTIELGPLAENGGPTKTMSIPRSGPAFNTGVRAACDATALNGAGGVDQRGFPRVTCSAGAYEPLPDLLIRKFAPGAARD